MHGVCVLSLKPGLLSVVRLAVTYNHDGYVPATSKALNGLVHLQNSRGHATRLSKSFEWGELDPSPKK